MPGLTPRQLTLRIGPAAGLMLAAVAGLVIATSSSGARDPLRAQPPDLVQDVPKQISVRTAASRGRVRYLLAFRSAAENRADASLRGGQLVLVGTRKRGQPTMSVDQYVDQYDPAAGEITRQQKVTGVGRMRYVREPDHQHWHVVGFERFELRRLADRRLVAPDRKTGFCVGNRYRLSDAARSGLARGARAPRVIARPDFATYCGLSRPGLRKVTLGLSPGSGDDYRPLVEGQYIDVTRVPSGRYVLVHRVNPSRAIRETDHTNNAGSALIELRRRAGRAPVLRVLRSCPRTDRCAPPGS